MELLQSLRWRYATKKFDPTRTVAEDQVTELLEATNLSATSYGLQPFKLVVIKNQEIQDRLIASSYGQRQVADASHVIVIAARTDVDAAYISQYVDYIESERNLDAGAMDDYKNVMIKTITGKTDEYRQQWAEKQGYIALATLLTACATMEIDACPMEGFIPSEYNEILGFDQLNLSATLVVPIGFRADDDSAQHQKKVRWPLSKMVIRM